MPDYRFAITQKKSGQTPVTLGHVRAALGVQAAATCINLDVQSAVNSGAADVRNEVLVLEVGHDGGRASAQIKSH